MSNFFWFWQCIIIHELINTGFACVRQNMSYVAELFKTIRDLTGHA